MTYTYNPPDGATVVSGGNWIATKGPDGKTYYQSSYGAADDAAPIANSEKYTGPIIISNATLTVAPGADVSGAYVSSLWSTPNAVYVSSGGTFESSTHVNGNTYVSSGGLSSGNMLVSDEGKLYSGGTSLDDTFIVGDERDGTGSRFLIDSHAHIGGHTVVGSGVILDAEEEGHVYIESPIEVEPGGELLIASAGTTVGNGQPNSGIANAHPHVGVPNPPIGVPVISGGNWEAVKNNETGITYYQSALGAGNDVQPVINGAEYTGPVIFKDVTLTVTSGADMVGAYVSGPGWMSVDVQPGGILAESTIIDCITNVSSGGATYDNTFVSDNGMVSGGGTSISNIYVTKKNDAAEYSIASGAYLGGDTVKGEGYDFRISSGATVADTITSYIKEPQPGYLKANVVSGGEWIAYKASDGKTYYRAAEGLGASAKPSPAQSKTYDGPIIILNGDLTVTSGAVASGAYVSGGVHDIYIQPGGTLESSVHVEGYTIISSGGVSSDNLLLSDFGSTYSGGVSIGDTFTTTSGDTGVYNVAKGGVISNAYIGSGVTMVVQSGGTAISPTLQEGATYEVMGGQSEVCFLPGTLIRTPSGTVAVEAINPGDEIITYRDGVETPAHVTWVGQGQSTIHPERSDDQSGYPVRILKGALSDNVPFKDMLITAEHCLYFEGGFIPVRMLVNGRSIFYDKSITDYDYYHIEAEKHSVIMADGVLTESYLDTGNRSFFVQKGKVVPLRAKEKPGWEKAAAPLTVSREIVEPIFRQIEARAEEMGFERFEKIPALTNDADVHLVTDKGDVIRQTHVTGDHYMFEIPAGVHSVRIMSRVSRPCDAIGPFVDDRRQLGLLVGDVTMFEANQRWAITSHLKEVSLSGWSDLEDGSVRWTKGYAELPLGKRQPGHDAQLSLQIVAAGPYVVREAEAKQTTLSA